MLHKRPLLQKIYDNCFQAKLTFHTILPTIVECLKCLMLYFSNGSRMTSLMAVSAQAMQKDFLKPFRLKQSQKLCWQGVRDFIIAVYTCRGGYSANISIYFRLNSRIHTYM